MLRLAKAKSLGPCLIIGFLLLFPALLCAQVPPTQSKGLESKSPKNAPSIFEFTFQINSTVYLQVIPETGTLIVTGKNKEDVEKVRQLAMKIVASFEKTLPKIKRIKMKNAHAQYVASWAQKLYDDNFLAKHGKVTISSHNQSEIQIIGQPGGMAEAERLVHSLDR